MSQERFLDRLPTRAPRFMLAGLTFASALILACTSDVSNLEVRNFERRVSLMRASYPECAASEDPYIELDLMAAGTDNYQLRIALPGSEIASQISDIRKQTQSRLQKLGQDLYGLNLGKRRLAEIISNEYYSVAETDGINVRNALVRSGRANKFIQELMHLANCYRTKAYTLAAPFLLQDSKS